jgi:hypothetical protein
MNQWFSKRQTTVGQLDQDGSLKASLVSLSNEMTQITLECRPIECRWQLAHYQCWETVKV